MTEPTSSRSWSPSTGATSCSLLPTAPIPSCKHTSNAIGPRMWSSFSVTFRLKMEWRWPTRLTPSRAACWTGSLRRQSRGSRRFHRHVSWCFRGIHPKGRGIQSGRIGRFMRLRTGRLSGARSRWTSSDAIRCGELHAVLWCKGLALRVKAE